MKITAVIPIRSGSQRVKDKNLRPFANTTLMENKINSLLQVPELDSIIVNTNSEEAIEIGKQGEICYNSTEGLYSMVKRLLDEPSKLSLYRQYIKDNPVTNDISKKQFESIINKI